MVNRKSDLVKAVRSRNVMRNSFGLVYDKVLPKFEAVDDAEVREEIESILSILKDKLAEIGEMDSLIYNYYIADSTMDEADLAAEVQVSDEFQLKFSLIEIKFKKVLNMKEGSDVASVMSVRSVNDEMSDRKRSKLPKIKLVKFNGNTIDYLSWWNQFQEIDGDESIATIDKFHYLVQSMVKGSRSHRLVTSFPCSTANYTKALDSLKSRFGRNDMLVEVYVRELLKLVLSNVNSKKRFNLSELYDRLETQLRALESLGVTSDTCSAILFPLVESCLPEKVLRAWQRNHYDEDDASLKKRLKSLIASSFKGQTNYC